MRRTTTRIALPAPAILLRVHLRKERRGNDQHCTRILQQRAGAKAGAARIPDHTLEDVFNAASTPNEQQREGAATKREGTVTNPGKLQESKSNH